MLDLHRRYRQADEQLAELLGDRETVGRSPHDRVTEFFYRRQNYVPDLDEAAERLAATIGMRRGEVRSTLQDRLAQRHGVQVRRDDATLLGDELHRYRPQTRTLHLSTSLRAGQQAMRMAAQIALLEYADVIDEIVEEERFDDPQTQILTRVGLANYFAAALILPYEPFLAAAEQHRYDIDLLTQHFTMGWETVCHRLSTLQRPRARGVPFSFVRVDRAGNMSKRQSATGFPFSLTGGTCPLWNVYEAFSAPGRVVVQVAADARRAALPVDRPHHHPAPRRLRPTRQGLCDRARLRDPARRPAGLLHRDRPVRRRRRHVDRTRLQDL